MSHTRELTGTVHTPEGLPWEDFQINFTLTPAATTVHATLPSATATAVTGPDGTFALDLEVDVAYRVTLYTALVRSGSSTQYPPGAQFGIVVPAGDGPISLEAVRAAAITPAGDPTVADFAADHLGRTDNPHAVTAAQVGAYTTGQVDAALATKADAAQLAAHAGDTGNPHAVTAAQVGLGSVDNTADAAKPVSGPQQAAFDALADATATALAGKSDTGHQHAAAEITDFAGAVAAVPAVAANTAARHTHANAAALATVTAQTLVPAGGRWYQVLSRDPATLAPAWVDPPGVVVPLVLVGLDGNLDGLNRNGTMVTTGVGAVRWQGV